MSALLFPTVFLIFPGYIFLLQIPFPPGVLSAVLICKKKRNNKAQQDEQYENNADDHGENIGITIVHVIPNLPIPV